MNPLAAAAFVFFVMLVGSMVLLPVEKTAGMANAAAGLQIVEHVKALSHYERAARIRENSPDAQLSMARSFIEKGEYSRAEETCRKVLVATPQNSDALNLLGQVLKLIGQYEAARSHFQEALSLNPNHLGARLNLGIMQNEWSEYDASRQTLQFFISYYQSHPNLSAEELTIIAQACVYLNRVRDANDLFNDATRVDKTNWQAFIPWGNLFLLKYNIPDAAGAFEDALKINPNAAEAYLGLARCSMTSDFEKSKHAAETALDKNPNSVEAQDLLAELEIAVGDFKSALGKLEKQLQVNPNALTTRSLRAVCFYFLKDDQNFRNEETKILSINPEYGELYFQIAEHLSRRYLFKESVDYYRKGLALDGENWNACAGLGTSLSRIGDEAAAKAELEKAFANDPFNKYVGNLLTLFDEYPKYKIHRTVNFAVRIHEQDDPVLSNYAIDLAHESQRAIDAKYPVNNAAPFVLEIFPEHDDFAVRCFGLPGSQAFLGICFGNVVAMDSPRARPKGDFIWGETLWHELVHVSHLRLTENRIPRWLAEGIAVYETSTAKPYWQMNLDVPLIQAYLSNRLLPLKDLDTGFNRPTNPGQVSLSYFQASLVVEFLVKKYGHDRLLATFPKFRSGMETEQIFKSVYGKDLNILNEEFLAHLKEKYHFDAVDYEFAHPETEEQALSAKLKVKPNNPFLNYQLGVYYKESGDFSSAIPLLQKARELFPNYVIPENPYRALAEVYLKTGQKSLASKELTDLTSRNGKELQPLQMLADLCVETKNYAGAIEALKKVLYITPFESAVHQKLAAVYLAQKKYEDAIRELQTLLLTGPPDIASAHCDLADAYLQSGKKAEAKKSALQALEIAPNYERAQQILLACLE